LVTEEFVEFLRTQIYYFQELAKNQKKYQKGTLVEIQTGPFKGFEATLDAYDKDQNVFILLKFLERT
jgi:transcription antitermination factor NusG